APGYGQTYGNWNTVHGHCTALDSFQLHGSKVNKDFTTDPYVETVQRGLNYLLEQYTTNYLTQQPAGNPDANHNGLGLTISSQNSTYVEGICGTAIASSGAPNYI